MRSPCESGSLAGRNGSASKALPAPASPARSSARSCRTSSCRIDERRLAPVGGDVDEVVAVGLERRLADDVEVGDDVALRRDEEARADRGLAGAALQDGADLDQLRARLLVDLARRQRHRRGGHGGRCGRGGGSGRVARRRRTQLRRRGRCGQCQHAQGCPAPDANPHPRRFYGPTLLTARSERRCYSGSARPARRQNQTGDTAPCNDAA